MVKLITFHVNSFFLAELFAVGSHYYDHNKETEIYSFEDNRWRHLPRFPYGSGSDLYGITAVYLKGYFYTFGGYSSGDLNNIARLDPVQGTYLLKIEFCKTYKDNGQMLAI